MSPHEVLTFKFYERYDSYLKNSYLDNSSLFFTNYEINDEQFTPLHDNAYINNMIRLNNKKKAWASINDISVGNNFFMNTLLDNKESLNKDFLFTNRKRQFSYRKNILSIINPESKEFEKAFRAFTDLNESSR
jgi:hypothetical protein